MMNTTRKQLTLFLDSTESSSFEIIRECYNPEQFRIIKCHITLCREDEIEEIETIQQNLEGLNLPTFNLKLGEIQRFSKGNGVLIGVADIENQFENLRRLVLQNVIAKPRDHKPHITLMHPRNSKCTDSEFAKIQGVNFPTEIKISNVSLIEQELRNAWKILREYPLN
ncbi:MAG: 2'-5' RNA ligase family protein [Cyclobacteriaceae bacterium]